MPSELTELLGAHLRDLGYRPPEPIRVRVVRQGQLGDVATAVARTVAGPDAQHLASRLAGRLRSDPGLAQVRAEAGYLTLTLTTGALAGGVRRLLSPGAARPSRRVTTDRWPADLRPVAFAHARCRNVARAAHAHGVRPPQGEDLEVGLTAVVGNDCTRSLLVRLGTPTPAGRGAAVTLRELATSYQDFYARTRTAPRGSEPVTSTHRIHLALTEASAVALAAGLSSFGLHAPEHL